MMMRRYMYNVNRMVALSLKYHKHDQAPCSYSTFSSYVRTLLYYCCVVTDCGTQGGIYKQHNKGHVFQVFHQLESKGRKLIIKAAVYDCYYKSQLNLNLSSKEELSN